LKYTPTVARRYAEALAQLAQEQGLLDTLSNELNMIAYLIKSQSELATVLYSPHMPVKTKEKIIAAALAHRISPLSLNFVLVLVRKRREQYMEDIIAAYVHYADAVRNIVQADVRVARPISPTQEEALRQQLAKYCGKQVRLETHIDPSILGGVIVQIGGITIDGSVTTRLRQLQDAVPEANIGLQE